MIEQIETFEGNTLAIEVIDGFTENDEQLCQKWFRQKVAEGYNKVNVLVKLDEMKVAKSSIKAFMEDVIWVIRHFQHLGHLAVVAHSNTLRALVPIDNLFFYRAGEGRYERYFDASQLDEAIAFVQYQEELI